MLFVLVHWMVRWIQLLGGPSPSDLPLLLLHSSQLLAGSLASSHLALRASKDSLPPPKLPPPYQSSLYLHCTCALSDLSPLLLIYETILRALVDNLPEVW